MGLDEILFRGINGVAGQSSLLDWVMVELAKPSNLLYPVLRRNLNYRSFSFFRRAPAPSRRSCCSMNPTTSWC